MKINFLSPDLILSGKIAIVGSSDLLLGSGSGSSIDSCEQVVRFNRAPALGYESDVGSKTTIRVVNNHVFAGKKLDPKKWKNQPADFVKKLRDLDICYFGPDLGPWQLRYSYTDSSCRLFRFKYEEMATLKNIFAYAGNKNFTVGAGFVCVCVSSGIIPEVYGFDLENRHRGHYFEPTPPMGSCHDRNKEQILLKRLQDDGKIIIK